MSFYLLLLALYSLRLGEYSANRYVVAGKSILNEGNLTLTFSAHNRSLILHYWMKAMVLCYSLLDY